MLSGKERTPVSHSPTMPTLTGVEVLPDGTARFTLNTRETAELTPEGKAALSGPNYAPCIAWLNNLDGLDGLAFIVPDALICRAVEAMRLTAGGQT